MAKDKQDKQDNGLEAALSAALKVHEDKRRAERSERNKLIRQLAKKFPDAGIDIEGEDTDGLLLAVAKALVS